MLSITIYEGQRLNVKWGRSVGSSKRVAFAMSTVVMDDEDITWWQHHCAISKQKTICEEEIIEDGTEKIWC